MSDDDEWYSPNRKPPVRKIVTVPGEVMWTITVNHIEWSCEFRFLGEDYGWDVRLLRAGDFFGSHRFILRAAAERWANEQKQQIERGWLDC
jgi:hypothetical protein